MARRVRRKVLCSCLGRGMSYERVHGNISGAVVVLPDIPAKTLLRFDMSVREN